MKRIILLSLLALLSVGCHHKLEFTSFGQLNSTFDRQVVEGYRAIDKARASGPGPDEIVIYMKTFPPGVTMDGGTVSIAPDSTRRVIGTFRWVGDGILPGGDEMNSELGKIAEVAGGNEIVILDAYIDRGYLNWAEGLVVLHEWPSDQDVPKVTLPETI